MNRCKSKTNLDGSELSFEQDRLITFEEASHRYFVAGVGEMMPVSSVIGMFFKPFDAEYWSNKKHPGDAAAAARRREEWGCKGTFASQAGTFMHKQIEDYLNGKQPQSLTCTVSYDGTYIRRQKQVDISCEWRYFLAFSEDVKYTPFRTEWRVYDAEAKMAGTIDLLCSRQDGTYEIYDWKRSSKINPLEYNQWASGRNGLEHLTDTTYMHYCLQQNLYRYMLEKNYGITVSRMTLVVLHPDLPAYRLVSIPRMNSEVETIIRYMHSCTMPRDND